MKRISVTMVIERETKNKFRYKETPKGNADPVLDTLYIPKSVLGDTAPKSITVQVSAG